MDANTSRVYCAFIQCFNPRARDGRENDFQEFGVAVEVSIHAPVMDAKPGLLSPYVDVDVSIHAPVMDANHQAQQNTTSH